MKGNEEKVRVIILSRPEIFDFTATKEDLRRQGFELGNALYVWKKYFWEGQKKTFVYYEGHREPVGMPDKAGDFEKLEKDRALSALLFGAFSAEETQKKRLEQLQAQDRLPIWLFFFVLMVSLALNFVLSFKLMGVF